MKKTIKLNEEDISKIIADHFSVENTNVKICVKQESRGYGMSEHDENVVYMYVDEHVK